MIYIEEAKNKKIPGPTSLFITFDYNSDVVEVIKSSSDVRNYNKKNFSWEVPITNLATLLDRLCKIDEITLTLLEDSYEEKKEIEVDFDAFKTTPYQYQKEGIQYSVNQDRFLLLDAPGLGKSLQVIYAAQKLKELGEIHHCLIICGVNTLKHNWKREIQTHSDLSCRILGERTTRNGRTKIGSMKERLEELKHPIEDFFIITNIETLRDNKIVKELNNKKINNFDMIIVDEIHHCKSPTSQQGANLLKLTKAPHRIGLSGTILMNNPMDCFVPLTWIGAESCTYTNFKYYYCNYGGPFHDEFFGYRHLDRLKETLDKHSLRRKKDLLDLPPKNILHEFIDMEDLQSNFYSNITDGIIDQVDKVQINTTSLLAMISRLRQATACPSYLTTENIPSAKVERAIDLIKQITDDGSKVVVFSIFKETLTILQERLKSYAPLLCTGDVKDEIIAQNIKTFQADEQYKVMLATCQKMGTGITLTAATYAIFIDCPWTQADCLQCEDRIHRIGSKEPVFIYYLWTNNTIDTKVKNIVEAKGILSDYIVDDAYQPQFLDRLRQIITDLN